MTLTTSLGTTDTRSLTRLLAQHKVLRDRKDRGDAEASFKRYLAMDGVDPVILVINKWDQLHGTVPTDRWVRYLRGQFPTLAYAPIAFITGQTGKNVKALLNHATMLFKLLTGFPLTIHRSRQSFRSTSLELSGRNCHYSCTSGNPIRQ